MARSERLVIAGLGAVVLAVLGDVLFAGGTRVLGAEGTDLTLQFLSWREFGFGELAKGNLALWNPHVYGGAPYFGGMQSALLYPPNWLFLVLPLAQAMNWSTALDLWLFGAFTACWALRRDLHPLAAFVTGTLAMFSGPYFAHVYAGHVTNLAAMTWTPLAFLAFDDWTRTRSAKPCLLGMFAIAMQICAGHPQYVFYTGVALGLYALSIQIGGTRRGLLLALLGLSVIYAGGVLLSALQLFTAVQATSETIRNTRLPYAFASDFFFPFENLVTLLAPNALGDGVQLPYWGRGYLWEGSLFMGVAGLALAAYGMLRGETPHKRALLALAALTLLFALGKGTPLYALLYEYAPGFDRFRAIGKFCCFTSLVLCLFAGIGVDRLLRRGVVEPRVLRVCGLLVGVLLLASLAVRASSLQGVLAFMRDSGDSYLPAALYADPGFAERARALAANGLLVAAAALGLLLATWRFAPRAAWVVALIATLEVVVFARLGRATFDSTTVIDAELRRFLVEHPGDYRITNAGNPNSAMSLGARDVWGLDPGVVRRYAELVALTQGIAPEDATQYVTLRQPHPLFAVLRLGFAVAATRDGVRIAKSPTPPMPRFALLGSYRVVQDRDARLAAMDAADFDPRTTVMLEQRPDPVPRLSAHQGSVELIHEDTDSLELEATLEAPSVLLITDTWTSDWRAEPLAGSVQAAYHVLPADHAFRGIPLAAGKHRLRVEYVPWAYRLGCWTSALGWLAFLGACLVVARSRARATAAQRGPEDRRGERASASSSESGRRRAAASAAPRR